MSDDRPDDIGDEPDAEPEDGLDEVVRRAVLDEVPDGLRTQLHGLSPIRIDNVEIAPWMPAPAALQRDDEDGAAIADWPSAGHIIVKFAPTEAQTALAIRPEGFETAEPRVRVQIARAVSPFVDLDAEGRAAVPAHHVFRVVVDGPGAYATNWIA